MLAFLILTALCSLTTSHALRQLPTPFVVPFRQVEFRLISNLTEPEFPQSNRTYVGSVAYKVGGIEETIQFVLQTCLQAQTTDEIPNYPFLFWFDDLGKSSMISMLLESGSVMLSGDRTQVQRKYKIRNGSNPLNSKTNVVYVDLLGAGLSGILKSNDSVSKDIKATAQQISAFIDGFFQQLKCNGIRYYVAGRAYSSAALVEFASMSLPFPPKGLLLINGRFSPASMISTISEHFYNLGLLDLQERMRAEQTSLLLKYLIRHNQTELAYRRYGELLGYLMEAGGLEILDYYNEPVQQDLRVLDQFMNEPQVRLTFGINDQGEPFQADSEGYRQQYHNSFSDTTALLRGLSARKDLNLLLIQGQTDLEYHPLSVLRWLDTLFVGSDWGEQQLHSFQLKNSTLIDGFAKETDSGRFLFAHRQGRYIRNQQLLDKQMEWLVR